MVWCESWEGHKAQEEASWQGEGPREERRLTLPPRYPPKELWAPAAPELHSQHLWLDWPPLVPLGNNLKVAFIALMIGSSGAHGWHSQRHSGQSDNCLWSSRISSPGCPCPL